MEENETLEMLVGIAAIAAITTVAVKVTATCCDYTAKKIGSGIQSLKEKHEAKKAASES